MVELDNPKSAKTRKERRHRKEWMKEYLTRGYKVLSKTRWHIAVTKFDPCPHLSMDMKCELHSTDKQPKTCRTFPHVEMGNDQKFYRALKHKCSIKFKKVKA